MIDNRALLCAVVKSHAYGHGADLLLPSLVRLGVPFVGVGSNEEAAIARRCGFAGRILRVRAAAPQEIKAGLRHEIEELVADPQSAWEMHKIAAEAGKIDPHPPRYQLFRDQQAQPRRLIHAWPGICGRDREPPVGFNWPGS